MHFKQIAAGIRHMEAAIETLRYLGEDVSEAEMVLARFREHDHPLGCDCPSCPSTDGERASFS